MAHQYIGYLFEEIGSKVKQASLQGNLTSISLVWDYIWLNT